MKHSYLLAGLFKKVGLGLMLTLLFTPSLSAADITSGLKLHYTFESSDGVTVPDVTGNGYAGTLQGATVGVSNGKPSLLLSTSGTDYVDMGTNTGVLMSTLNNFTISTYVWVNETNTNLNANGNFVVNFGNSEDVLNVANGHIFLQAKRSRYAITPTNYQDEQAVQTGTDIVKGQWVQMTYTQQDSLGSLYINGELKNTNNAVTLKPSDIGATPYNYIARPLYNSDAYLQDAQIADFRIYDRALSSDEVLILNGYPADLIDAYTALTVEGELDMVTSDIVLPTTSGTANLPVVWTSSHPENLSITGQVTRPQKYDVTVTLTATMTLQNGEETYTLTKQFIVVVKSVMEMAEMVAWYTFDGETIGTEGDAVTVADQSGNEFNAVLKNDARIRVIGESEQFSVLDLGNGTGHLDMGEAIGEAVYALRDYSIMTYFRIDENYDNLSANGNFLYVFSNTDDAPTDRNGYMLGRLNSVMHEITPGYYASNNEQVAVGSAAGQGEWHHYAYVQQGNIGKVFIDGVEMKSATVTNLPSTAIAKDSLTGTKFNWIGRPNYPSDAYLRQTLVYDFQMYTVPLTQDNLQFDFAVSDVLSRLNNAYTENPDFISQNVVDEADNLTLGDLSAVTADISLPTQGTLDPEVAISWSSSHPQLIDNTGKLVSAPDYYDFNITLTATLSVGSQFVTKDFPATVKVKAGTEFTGDKIAHYDFSNAEGRFVKSLAEKQFEGTIVNEASIREIGTTETGKFNVLDLGNGTGYFDMGPEVGKVLVHAEDYTIAGYYRIDTAYTELGSNGNFLYTFSNSEVVEDNAWGYIIGSLQNQAHSITAGNWSEASGNQAVSFAQPALQGGWHHFAFTQQAGIGTIYVDGMPVAPGDITNTPASVLQRAGMLGTPFNWIGRSNYAADVYLRNTLVYDFRLYRKALSDIDILATELNVPATIEELDKAFTANPNDPSGLTPVTNSPYRIGVSNGQLNISGLVGGEVIRVYDTTGRLLQETRSSSIALDGGLYLVRIDNHIAKVLVP